MTELPGPNHTLPRTGGQRCVAAQLPGQRLGEGLLPPLSFAVRRHVRTRKCTRAEEQVAVLQLEEIKR
jgi:hypothetical protein